jgi:2-dehydro-3-deoxyphosphogluconate aldolase/(4S)-4-hydroxy-2-oxoglutarate aldolase
MYMHKVLEELGKIGVVPVIKIDDARMAVPLGRALITGGIPCAEVTFRTAAGEEAIRRMTAELPDLLVGAGTILNEDQLDRAIKAGAKFIVSPGFNPRVVRQCVEKGIPVTPGCSSPSDMEAAIELGLDVVKFFPAEQAGGLDFIKAVAAPYSQLMFMPTGGINALNITKYLAFEKILACGGSWMVPADALAAGNFDTITTLSREAIRSMLDFSLAHIGINTTNAEGAGRAAACFEALFGFPVKDGNSSVFAGTQIECMKAPYLGKYGHIAIGTASVVRAQAYLERNGFEFNEDSEKRDAKGALAAVYLREEIAGFAVHLVQRPR